MWVGFWVGFWVKWGFSFGRMRFRVCFRRGVFKGINFLLENWGICDGMWGFKWWEFGVNFGFCVEFLGEMIFFFYRVLFFYDVWNFSFFSLSIEIFRNWR